MGLLFSFAAAVRGVTVRGSAGSTVREATLILSAERSCGQRGCRRAVRSFTECRGPLGRLVGRSAASEPVEAFPGLPSSSAVAPSGFPVGRHLSRRRGGAARPECHGGGKAPA